MVCHNGTGRPDRVMMYIVYDVYMYDVYIDVYYKRLGLRNVSLQRQTALLLISLLTSLLAIAY